jgi:hypothetical protein
MNLHPLRPLLATAFVGLCISLTSCQTPPRNPKPADPVPVRVDQDVAVSVDKNGNVFVRTPDGKVSVRPAEALPPQPVPVR